MIKAIAFDLDDTLLDTTGLLVPAASLQAFTTLIQAGLKLSLEECEKYRLKMIKEISHKEVFEKIAIEYGDEKTQKASAEAIRHFYEPNFPTELPMLPGARENIDQLKHKYKLYLVTAGTEKSQKRKAKAIGVENDFEKIFVVNSLEKKRKKDVFLEIIKMNNLEPDQLLCVGNSLSSEIHDALQIGAMACYFEFGEDRGDLVEDLQMHPQYHIKNHYELIKACHL